MANRKCIVCGTEYSYCPSCREDRNKPKWMNKFDKEDCKDIFEVGCDFENGIIDASEASRKLQGKNLSNIISPSLKETLAKIGLIKKDKEIAKAEGKPIIKEEKKVEKSDNDIVKESEKKIFK